MIVGSGFGPWERPGVGGLHRVMGQNLACEGSDGGCNIPSASGCVPVPRADNMNLRFRARATTTYLAVATPFLSEV